MAGASNLFYSEIPKMVAPKLFLHVDF